MNTTRKHLMLALNRKGLGEAILGLRLASGLKAEGEEVFFLAHDSNANLFHAGQPHMTFSDKASTLLDLFIKNCLLEYRASSIILSDYLTTQLFMEGVGQNLETLLSLGVPIFAIDTWGSSAGPQKIDMLYDAPAQDVPEWPAPVKPLCPVPFLRPGVKGSYYSLPEPHLKKNLLHDNIRSSLRLKAGHKTVLFCTAEWQHPKSQPAIRRGTKFEAQWEVARRFADSLPALVGEYLRDMRDVHLVHVGPEAFEIKDALGARYHWLPPLSPAEFDQLVASVDLLLSANISATTIAKAMVNNIPVLVLQNSVAAENREGVEAGLGIKVSQRMAKWLETSVPVFPCSLWPLGYYRFLAPILRENPYAEAVEIVELLNEQLVREALRRLLFNRTARASQMHRQASYLSQVHSLPTGAQALRAALA